MDEFKMSEPQGTYITVDYDWIIFQLSTRVHGNVRKTKSYDAVIDILKKLDYEQRRYDD